MIVGRSVRRDGFTLVELLVVIAIIAVLMSVLLPSLRSAREQAKQTRCAANLRTFGQGFHAYATENQDYFCSGAFNNGPNTDGPVDRVGWVADLLNARLAFPGAQLCPSSLAKFNQKLQPPDYTAAQARDLIARGYNTNYTQSFYMARTEVKAQVGAAANVNRPRDCIGPLQASKWSTVSSARILMLGDARTNNNSNAEQLFGEPVVKSMCDGPYDKPYGPQDFDDFGPAHGFGNAVFNSSKRTNRIFGNMLFADGHVRAYRDKNRNGEFDLVTTDERLPQADLDDSVFDGVLSIGRRTEDVSWQTLR